MFQIPPISLEKTWSACGVVIHHLSQKAAKRLARIKYICMANP
jgi:hypothetical protein